MNTNHNKFKNETVLGKFLKCTVCGGRFLYRMKTKENKKIVLQTHINTFTHTHTHETQKKKKT